MKWWRKLSLAGIRFNAYSARGLPAPAKLVTAVFVTALLASCATPTAPSTARQAERMTVRTTAYCPGEAGGRRNAIGQFLSGRTVHSAASDWSYFPVGTRFKMVRTGEDFVIDDYGYALVGSRTIDLYKRSRAEMKNWGVRQMEIEILKWGSFAQSIKVLTPRAHNGHIHRMLLALALANKKDKVAARRL